MKHTVSLSVLYKGYDAAKDTLAKQALRDFVKTKFPQLGKFYIEETGSGFDLSSKMRDIGFIIEVTGEPILAGSLVKANCQRKTHRHKGFKIEASVYDVKP